MRKKNYHFEIVDLWTSHALVAISLDEMIEAFDQAFSRIWRRAEITLGKITVRAVADRVMSIAADDFPWIKSYTFKSDEISFKAGLAPTAQVSEEELKAGLSFVLGEFLSVLGSLTAELISKKLHSTLLENLGGDEQRSIFSKMSKESENSVGKDRNKS
ncbi:MAG: hypothetical protein EOP04_22780 [Proteobacteria bacterium]|nr:MAG: hypothetical protein EOP04_22780 [Pseudomonadota bacterium]